MFTGNYETSMERFENVVINTSVTAMLIMLVLKLTGLCQFDYLVVFLPIIIPIVVVMTLVVLARIFLYTADVFYNISEYLKKLIGNLNKK